MKKLMVCLSVLGFALAAQAEHVVFQRSTKKHWVDYRVQSISYYKEKTNVAGVAVWLKVPDIYPEPPRVTPPPDVNPSYLDTYQIKGLSFDRSIGKRGAIVYNDGVTKTVCATKQFIGYKRTGACGIDVQEGASEYKISLIIK